MITKPHDYRHSWTIDHDVPYEISGNQKGTHAGKGTLHAGRVVWTREALPIEITGASVSAYVDGVGVISLDPHSLHQVSS